MLFFKNTQVNEIRGKAVAWKVKWKECQTSWSEAALVALWQQEEKSFSDFNCEHNVAVTAQQLQILT